MMKSFLNSSWPLLNSTEIFRLLFVISLILMATRVNGCLWRATNYNLCSFRAEIPMIVNPTPVTMGASSVSGLLVLANGKTSLSLFSNPIVPSLSLWTQKPGLHCEPRKHNGPKKLLIFKNKNVFPISAPLMASHLWTGRVKWWLIFLMLISLCSLLRPFEQGVPSAVFVKVNLNVESRLKDCIQQISFNETKDHDELVTFDYVF